MSGDLNKTSNIQPLAFWPAAVAMIAFVACGVFASDTLGNILNGALSIISQRFGWLFMLFCLGILFLLLFVAFSRFGDIRIGGKNARPELTMWQWLSIALCSSIGTGILFWGLGEPIYHLATPAEATGIQPFTRAAGIYAVSQAAFHWTLIQYALYTFSGVAIAVTAYNATTFSIGNSLEGLLGKERAHGPVGQFCNALCIFSLCGGVGCSTAVAVLQAGGGLHTLFGMPENNFTWLLITLVITGIFVVSAVTGMKKGLSIISDINAKIFLGMLLFIFLVGPTTFLADLMTTSFGDYLSTFWQKATISNILTTDEWAKSWTVQYWASYIGCAPLIGMFYARLAKGRTMRQFIFVSLLVPSAFSFVWISMFGGMTVNLQLSGTFDIWKNVQENGMQHAVFSVLQSFPFASVFICVFLFALICSIVTYADPMTGVLASMSSRIANIEQEASRPLKILWGLSIGATAYLLIVSGGVNSVRGLFTLVGFPLMLLMIAVAVSTMKSCNKVWNEQFHRDN